MDGFFEVSVLRLKMLWRQIHAFRPHYSRQQLHAASPDTRKVLLLIVLCRTTMSCASPARHQSATAGQRLASDARRLGLYCQGTYPLSPPLGHDDSQDSAAEFNRALRPGNGRER